MDLIFQSVDSIWLAIDWSGICDGFANSKTAFTIIEHVDGMLFMSYTLNNLITAVLKKWFLLEVACPKRLANLIAS